MRGHNSYQNFSPIGHSKLELSNESGFHGSWGYISLALPSSLVIGLECQFRFEMLHSSTEKALDSRYDESLDFYINKIRHIRTVYKYNQLKILMYGLSHLQDSSRFFKRNHIVLTIHFPINQNINEPIKDLQLYRQPLH